MAYGKPGRRMLRNDETIIDFWLSGYNYNEISYKMHLSKSVVWRVIDTYKKEHPEIKPEDKVAERQAKEIDVGKVGALYKAHWSIQEIAHEFYAPEEIIIDIMKKEGMIK